MGYRLLDWTANALAGLYFACAKNPKKPAKVWAMHRPQVGTNDIDPFDFVNQKDERALFKFLGPATPDYLKIIYPFYNSPRLAAQDGAFTVHSDPWVSLEKYMRRHFDGRKYLHLEALYWWCIPAENKVGIVKELSGLGITERTVYPISMGLLRVYGKQKCCGTATQRKIM
jgi:hypothetical protein